MSSAQLIDAHGVFTGNLPPTSHPRTRSYRIVAVVGCQSGGKSTLLNHTFGTSFPVLDAPKKGRRRTTLGIWAAVTESTETPFVVLDVEGTDSRERGEGAKTFESRTTLFTLALADCVLVNMWAHDIGRYSAANYDLFETVFAHAVALRRTPHVMARHPVPILIVVRDHDGESALSDIRRVLMGDLTNIWESLQVRDAALSDVFHIDVVALPHKMYAPDAFAMGVQDLSKQINHGIRSRRDSQLVPLEAFDTMARTVWDGVCRCTGDRRDRSLQPSAEGNDAPPPLSLDLPQHATLTAYYRCGVVISDMFQGEIGLRLQDLRTDIESNWQKPLSDFRSRVAAIVRDAFAHYDEAATPYRESGCSGDAVEKRRGELGSQLTSRVMEVRDRFLSVCWDTCMNAFEDDFRPMLGGTNGFDRRARRMANSHVARYRTLALDAAIPSVLEEFVQMQEAEEEVLEVYNEEGTEGLEFVDMEVDVETGLLGEVRNDETEEEEYSVERFQCEVNQKVEERRRLGDLMLPGAVGMYGGAGPKRDPWWKGFLIRGLILLINYLQATQGHRAAIRLHRQHDKEFPPAPTF